MLQYCALAEVPGFSPAQLEDLTRSIEQKKQKLEDDINAYITRKQDDLRRYEREASYHPGTCRCQSPKNGQS
jgi:hypothetical protein